VHLIWYGLLIGWGVAIPFGPINLEIVRRNLTYGTRYGLAFGMGACAVDATFLLLFSLGALAIINHPYIIKSVAVIGALLLIWFGIKALRAKPQQASLQAADYSRKLWRHALESYMLTMSSPFTIIFWTSISSQVALMARAAPHALAWMTFGVILGTLSWEVALNSFLHVTKHRLPSSIIHWLNIAGGLILICMAFFSLYYVFIRLP
jgi:threonine/homoserine/homoserine lactone efflux protein